jgi:hypothetical protein
MTIYQCVLVLKFLSVMGFAGGAIGVFLATEDDARKRAVHRIASPSLLLVWLLGYALLMIHGWPLFELWVVSSVVLSVITNGVLSYCAARSKAGPMELFCTIVPLVAIVALMVFKPTWAQVTP